MKELNDLELMLNTSTPVIMIDTLEEVRAIQLLARLGLRTGHPIFQWAVTEGLKRLEADFGAQKITAEPPEVLKHIRATTQPGYYVLLDFHPYLDDPIHIRLIKETAQAYEQTPRKLIFISHSITPPPEIKHLTARFQLQLPDRSQIKSMIKEEARLWQRQTRLKLKADASAVDKLATNLMGVTTTDAKRLIRSAIEDDGAITQNDLPRVMDAKYQLIDQGGVISFEYDTATFRDVAGLGKLKSWLEQRKSYFMQGKSKLDPPKGVLLLGVQGGGKSLAAKAVAGTFGLPLLRLDFGALYNKYIGETEKNLRNALKIAETMAPCIVWMDEIEKGISQDNSDDGVSRRLLGTLLTWMAEKQKPVFIVATANDIEKLPPELIRKGRLDEIFFVDLPSAEIRKEILSIHLRGRNLAPSGFDLDVLTEACEGFTGAEIEQAIVSALYASHAKESAVNSEGILHEIDRTSPLSVVMAEKIQALRAWAKERTVPAD